MLLEEAFPRAIVAAIVEDESGLVVLGAGELGTATLAAVLPQQPSGVLPVPLLQVP